MLTCLRKAQRSASPSTSRCKRLHHPLRIYLYYMHCITEVYHNMHLGS